jgi:hypothetical protein
MVGLDGIEPSTSRLSGVRSNRTELQAPIQRALFPKNNATCKRTILDLSKLSSDNLQEGLFFLSLERR